VAGFIGSPSMNFLTVNVTRSGDSVMLTGPSISLPLPDEFKGRVSGTEGVLGIRPEHLEIELTESAVMMDPEDAINKMTSLRGMDVRIALDDFGTGYSSLSYLKRLPVTGLKIDQSFIRDLAFDPDDAAIVRAIVAVGHELMLEVTAEGVETAEQAEFLKTRGCNEVQGYYFARPVPADQMRALLERGTLPVV
jgi:EAL domain-containing protein (putative c-di-GMP-specific phosphodiesterase class I)